MAALSPLVPRTALLTLCLFTLATGVARAQTHTVTTADGQGADAMVRQFDSTNDDLTTTNFGTDGRLFARTSVTATSSNVGAFEAIFLRFDLSDYLGQTFGGSTTLGVTKWRDNDSGKNVNVYGLTDGAADGWIEGNGGTDNNPAGELTYANAPGIATDSIFGDNDVDTGVAPLLGSFQLTGNQGQSVNFSSPQLTNFLNSDTNGLATFILARDVVAGDLEDIASKETTTLGSGATIAAGSGAPTLTFNLAVPAPPADHGALADNYAEGMIENGTDTYDSQPGSVQSPLFAAQMQRGGADDFNVPLDPHGGVFPSLDDFGVRYKDRAWGSANAHHHTELFALLYAKTAETGDPRYADAADAAIQHTFNHLRDGLQDWLPGTQDENEATDLIAWGEEMSWMLHYDRPRLPGDGILDGTFDGRPFDNDLHEPSARWSPQLWDRTYALAEAGAKAFALGLWNHQIADQTTGDFSRHPDFSNSNPRTGADFPRVGAWMMLAWAKGFEHVDDATFDATMIEAIDTIAENYNLRRDPFSDALSAGRGGDFTNVYWMDNNLVMATEIGLILQVSGLPQATVDELADLAARTDDVILNKLTHNLDGSLSSEDPNFTIGFLTRAITDQVDADGNLAIGDPRGDQDNASRPPFTSTWGEVSTPTSSIALLMLERAGQLDGVNQANADAYRDLALEAAGIYRTADPNQATVVLKPGVLASAIELMLAAFNETDDLSFLDQAEFFGDEAAAMFFDDTSVLPKVTQQHDFYEAITGGDNLALALYRLDQQLAAIPEPTMLLLMGIGAMAIACGRPQRTRRIA